MVKRRLNESLKGGQTELKESLNDALTPYTEIISTPRKELENICEIKRIKLNLKRTAEQKVLNF